MNSLEFIGSTRTAYHRVRMSTPSRSHALVFLTALMLAAGCATFAPPPRVAKEPTSGPVRAFDPSRPAVALVLSGGTARGFAHVGVLKVLEKNGIKPDLVVGSSAGSIVGALYASGLSPAEIDAALADMQISVFRDLVLPGLGFLPGELGLVKGENLRQFISARLRHPLIEDFPVRFAAVATDLKSGNPEAFTSGDASLAVRASSAVPGIITPAEIRGRYYADGQISSPLPAMTARNLGAKIVIAIDVLYPPQEALLSNILNVVFQSFVISSYRLRAYESREADIVITPEFPPTRGQYGFSDREWLVQVGERAAATALPAIRALLSEAR
jgi:NTE family protein